MDEFMVQIILNEKEVENALKQDITTDTKEIIMKKPLLVKVNGYI